MIASPLEVEVPIVFALIIVELASSFSDRAHGIHCEGIGRQGLNGFGALLAYLVNGMLYLRLSLHIEGIVEDAAIFEEHEEAAHDLAFGRAGV